MQETAQQQKPDIGAPLKLASVEVAGDGGLRATVYQMVTGGYFVHVEFSTGAHYYTPIFRDDYIARAEMARMAHNAAIIAEARHDAEKWLNSL